MLSKEILVEILEKSWKKRPLPSWAVRPAHVQQVDVGRALMLLGSITTPNGLSAGSPERYWACVRYFSACAESDDLRIRFPFTGLDPHQKGILSDDFGVAISTSWLVDKFGGFRNITDGRQFMVNMGVRKSKAKLPKVGPRKCPDFIIEDLAGKLHVLECKGTQSGRDYLNRAMSTGLQQKKGVKIEKSLRGESLVIGVSLSDERNKHASQLVVVDPESVPLTIVNPSNRDRASDVMKRLSLAKALNLTGFSRLAFEISWPDEESMGISEVGLLTSMERASLAVDRGERQRALRKEVDAELMVLERRMQGDFVVQTMQFELPAITLDSGEVVHRLTLRRGANAGVVQRLADADAGLREAFCEEEVGTPEVSFREVDNRLRLDYGNLFFSEMEFD